MQAENQEGSTGSGKVDHQECAQEYCLTQCPKGGRLQQASWRNSTGAEGRLGEEERREGL